MLGLHWLWGDLQDVGVEDFDNYHRVHRESSKMMSAGARKDKTNEHFG